jgi:hypothetical protein
LLWCPPFLCKENDILMVKSSIFKHSHILKRHWYSRNRLSAVTLSRTYATARLWLFRGFPNLPCYQRVSRVGLIQVEIPKTSKSMLFLRLYLHCWNLSHKKKK